MADIFLSYARQDHGVATALARALTDEGWSVWWDQEMASGDNFRAVIHQELQSAHCVVVLWSENSIASEWVLDEASKAKAAKKLLPAFVASVEPPLGFGQIHTADLVGWDVSKYPEKCSRFKAAIAARLKEQGVNCTAPREYKSAEENSCSRGAVVAHTVVQIGVFHRLRDSYTNNSTMRRASVILIVSAAALATPLLVVALIDLLSKP